MPSKYTKLEESFDGFMNRSMVRFDFEKWPLHTIIYGGTGTGKTYFVRQYLKLYQQNPFTDQKQKQKQEQEEKQEQDNEQDYEQEQKQMVEHDQRSIIIVCKDERDLINPETGNPYDEFNMCDISKIRTQYILKLQNSVILLDDMGDKFNSHIKIILQKEDLKIFKC